MWGRGILPSPRTNIISNKDTEIKHCVGKSCACDDLVLTHLCCEEDDNRFTRPGWGTCGDMEIWTAGKITSTEISKNK